MDDETVRFGPLEDWAREAKIPVEILKVRLRRVPPIRARAEDGTPIDFYAEEDVRKYCPEVANAGRVDAK